MKKLIRFIIIGAFSNFLASDYLFAQGGNLQFSQVINYSLTGLKSWNLSIQSPEYPIFQSIVINIPAGKVWKIESASVNLKSEPVVFFKYSNSDQTVLMLNSIELVKEISNSYSNSLGFFPSNFSQVNIKYPFWISSGSYTLKLTGEYHELSGSYRANGFLSAIEYNIVP